MLAWLAVPACTPPIQGEPCGDVFDPDTIPELHVELDPGVWEALLEDYTRWEERWQRGEEVKPYHPVRRLAFQCQVVFDAYVRLKGNPCCSWGPPKMQFAFRFDHFRDDGRLQGLRKIALDAPYYDPSLLRERASYRLFEQIGQPTSRVNHVRLYIDGTYYGLYANVEPLDRSWLRRHYDGEDAEGVRWKLDYLRAEMRPRPEDAPPEAHERWDALMAARTVEELDALLDLPTSMGSWAAEALVNQSDGYAAGGVNFVVYDHPRYGFQVLPWDLDNGWDRWPPGVSPLAHPGDFAPTAPFAILMADPQRREAFRAVLTERHARADPEALVEEVRRWAAMIRPSLEEEPLRPFTMEEHDAAVDALVDAIRARHAFLADWLADPTNR